MEKVYSKNGVKVTLNKKGSDRYTKTSYPVRYGVYSELETDSAVYQFNQNGEIVHVKGKGADWLNPQEWLKRSAGNDWVYYSTGGYTGVFEAIGEFYLPNLQYPTNSLLGGTPFNTEPVNKIITCWHRDLLAEAGKINGAPPQVSDFFNEIISATPQALEDAAKRLFQVSGGRVTVLPPDSRHVDYDIIPLTVSSGCLYKCRFCKIKNSRPFEEKERSEIDFQLQEIKKIYGRNLSNYNSVFLGEHDALNTSADLLLYSIKKSYDVLNVRSSHLRGANYFLFGSVDSLLKAEERLFAEMKNLPCSFYINIGLESADQNTLDKLGKPITESMVRDAFKRIQEINDRYINIEITANFLMDEDLPDTHYPRFVELVRDSLTRKKPKGCIYLSPIKFGNPSRGLVLEFSRLKLLSRLPTFLYIIQRL